jgi:hypothetical protein
VNRGIEQYHDTEFKQKPLQSESGVSVRDLEGNEYPLQATITYDKELNGNQSISFRVLPSKVNTFIHDITEMWEVVADTDYKIIYCKKRGEGDKLSVEIKAIPVFFDTFDTQRIYEEYNEHMTANYCFNLIFTGSGYNVVLNGTFEAIQWEGFGQGDTRLEMFKRALNRYRAEFYVSGNTIYIENLIGRDTQFQYRYKLNASNIVQENDASAYWTYAKGYGDYGDGGGGDDWKDAKLIREYTSPIASIIGIREAPPIKNGNITTAETMDSQLKTLVDDSLKISVTADTHDLKNYPLAQPTVGDRAFLIDERIGLETEIRIQQLTIVKDWKGNVISRQALFGSPNIVKRHQANMKSAVNSVTQLLQGNIKLPFNVLDNAVAEATKALQRMESQLTITDNGSLMAVDTTDPNNVVVLNAAGLGVSDDGGATFENAITGQGINGRTIMAKSVLGDVIAGGILQSLNSDTIFNLNDGILDFYNNASIRFNSSSGGVKRVESGTQSFVSFAISQGKTSPMVSIGTLDSDGVVNVNNADFQGFRIHNKNSELDSNYVGSRFAFTENVNTLSTGGIVIKPGWDGAVRGIYPVNTGSYSYDLGTSTNHWNSLYLNSKIHNNTGRLDIEHTSTPNQGFSFITNYVDSDGDGNSHLEFRGKHANEFYNLGASTHRWSYAYLNYQPDVSSDARLKENIHHNTLGLPFILDLETKTFQLTNNNPHMNKEPVQFGLIAQQLRDTLIAHGVDISNINMLSQGKNGMYGVAYTQLIAPIIKSIQELSTRLELLENGTT